MIFNGKTDVGVKRQTNQDSFAVLPLEDGSVFAIVCDGMGGANAGNVASSLAVKIITDFVERSYRFGIDYSSAVSILNNAISSANLEIYDWALKNPELKGMGTTVVASIISKDFTAIAHVGDSRAYFVNEDIHQITKDHSVVQSLIESGKLTPEEARVHPRRNVITRALGIEENIIPDNSECNMNLNDTLLLCSDGLSNFVEADVIKNIINNNSINTVADALIAEANKNGGGDNITAVVVRKD